MISGHRRRILDVEALRYCPLVSLRTDVITSSEQGLWFVFGVFGYVALVGKLLFNLTSCQPVSLLPLTHMCLVNQVKPCPLKQWPLSFAAVMC